MVTATPPPVLLILGDNVLAEHAAVEARNRGQTVVLGLSGPSTLSSGHVPLNLHDFDSYVSVFNDTVQRHGGIDTVILAFAPPKVQHAEDYIPGQDHQVIDDVIKPLMMSVKNVWYHWRRDTRHTHSAGRRRLVILGVEGYDTDTKTLSKCYGGWSTRHGAYSNAKATPCWVSGDQLSSARSSLGLALTLSLQTCRTSRTSETPSTRYSRPRTRNPSSTSPLEAGLPRSPTLSDNAGLSQSALLAGASTRLSGSGRSLSVWISVSHDSFIHHVPPRSRRSSWRQLSASHPLSSRRISRTRSYTPSNPFTRSSSVSSLHDSAPSLASVYLQ
ncbi:hypothetical protein DB88DRAFT_487963 [Papiliotrema laurentii]|uniref:Uncharacterized protein n=1 Tax=Papiliotrema laurentii TaxID=5418 RepID=A0AAD9L733_PAPLA|nr:hypothetical protein DB88DRAFT_487963 [Papiliotrema laurentii]